MKLKAEKIDSIPKDESPTLKTSVKEGMSHAVMVGAGETYLNPFGIFLKASSVQIGLLTTLPPLIGAIFQVVGVWLMERYKSRRIIIVCTAFLQALLWIPILFVPYVFGDGPPAVMALIVLAVIYYAIANVSVPIWNSLMGDLVPVNSRGSFFGYRNKQIGLISFISLVLAGQILAIYENRGIVTFGYAVIFTVAFISKVNSARWLARYEDPTFHFDRSHHFSFLQFLKRAPKSNFAKFVLFVATMNFAAYIAAPYFAFYMLNDIKMSYFEYTFVVAIATVSQYMTMQYWGSIADQFGNRKILTVCGLGVSTLPLFWLISSNTIVIALIQIFAGFMWAGFNLAAANFMFDAVTPPKRARCVAYQSIVNSVFVLAGSLLGSFLAENTPMSFPLSQGLDTPESPFIRVFFISGLLRFLTMLFLLKLFIEVREVKSIRHRDLIFRITSLRPLSGITFGVITGLRKRKEKLKDLKKD